MNFTIDYALPAEVATFLTWNADATVAVVIDQAEDRRGFRNRVEQFLNNPIEVDGVKLPPPKLTVSNQRWVELDNGARLCISPISNWAMRGMTITRFYYPRVCSSRKRDELDRMVEWTYPVIAAGRCGNVISY